VVSAESTASGCPDPAGRRPPIGPALIEFRLDDPDHRLIAARLWQEVGVRGDLLDLHWQGGAWQCRLLRPAVMRMEYRFDVTHADGTRESVLDPGNPHRVASAFGDRSVVTFPGYAPASWVTGSTASGRWQECHVPTPSLGRPVQARVWAPAGLANSEPAPLLVIHDGPEFEALASVSRYLSAAVRAGTIPALRAALLAPGHRDQWYAASAVYALALAGTVLPTLRERWPTTRVIGMGTSLGALAWMHAHRLHPDLVDGLFLQSGSFFHPDLDPQEGWFSGFAAISTFVTALHDGQVPGRPVPVAMTCGSVEENLANNRLIAHSLTRQGYPVSLREVPDAHNFTAWRDAFDPDLADLIVQVSRP
jgi:enterochelin esterase-like enzyme